MTKTAVVIPSVGRPEELAKCLRAVAQQSLLPYIVLVVTQRQDLATIDLARAFGARTVLVPKGGLAQAIETGLDAASTAGAELACFTDDDAIPRSDWLYRIVSTFEANPAAGIICGRDNINGVEPPSASNPAVGVISKGKIIGNHHAGTGSARVVDHAKGANMAIRVAEGRRVPLASLVYGNGAQAGNELILSMALKAQGRTCIYSPEIQVDHFPASRPASDDRFCFSPEKTFERAYNRTLGIVGFSPAVGRLAYLFRSAVFGDRANPGLVACLYWLPADRALAWSKCRVTMAAIGKGTAAGRRLRRTRLSVQLSGRSK